MFNTFTLLPARRDPELLSCTRWSPVFGQISIMTMRFAFTSNRKNNDVVITKRPKDTLYMPGVIDDPNLYVIYVTRDPRDVIVSRHGKARICTTRTLGFGVNCMPCTLIVRHDRFLNIRYEDFVNNPDATQAKSLQNFHGLRNNTNFLSTMNTRKCLKSQGCNAWRPSYWTDQCWCLAKTSRSHRPTAGNPRSMTPDLVGCGYESSPDWEAVLDGVLPDKSNSWYPEKNLGNNFAIH